MTDADKRPLAVIIIPTYNEAENIRRLIPILKTKIFPKIIDWRMALLVVDGHSPDGTGKVVEDLARIYPNLYLIKEGNKDGLGAAYLRGFKYLIQELRADVAIEFDADFQHPPEIIPGLLEKIAAGYDYVLGSRNIPGNFQPAGRDPLRLFLTNFGGYLTRLILFFPGRYFSRITDPTTGLKATRVKGVLDRLDLRREHLFSKKFGYKVQLLSEILALNVKYAEIPLKFGKRLAGESKFEKGTVGEILLACLKTRWRSRIN